jgi:hypothetical protein
MMSLTLQKKRPADASDCQIQKPVMRSKVSSKGWPATYSIDGQTLNVSQLEQHIFPKLNVLKFPSISSQLHFVKSSSPCSLIQGRGRGQTGRNNGN